jgi:hypothetical protein
MTRAKRYLAPIACFTVKKDGEASIPARSPLGVLRPAMVERIERALREPLMPIELDSAVADLAQAILSSKATMREVEDAIEESERQIKIRLGDAERGRAGQYIIGWPMRNFKAAAERVMPAKEAYSVRQSTLNIKELKS